MSRLVIGIAAAVLLTGQTQGHFSSPPRRHIASAKGVEARVELVERLTDQIGSGNVVPGIEHNPALLMIADL